jgi:hypothetical protein
MCQKVSQDSQVVRRFEQTMGSLSRASQRDREGTKGELKAVRSKISGRMNPDFMLMDVEKSGRRIFKG